MSRTSSIVSFPPVVAGSAVLYCVTCDQPLSGRCVISGAHRDHRLKELKDTVNDQVVRVRVCLLISRNKKKYLMNRSSHITGCSDHDNEEEDLGLGIIMPHSVHAFYYRRN